MPVAEHLRLRAATTAAAAATAAPAGVTSGKVRRRAHAAADLIARGSHTTKTCDSSTRASCRRAPSTPVGRPARRAARRLTAGAELPIAQFVQDSV